MFISFEGIEGSGKSTLLAGVAARLRSEGRETLETREPGGTPAGETIRRLFLEPGLRIDPLTETLLINASRAQLVAEAIEPALARGKTVLVDRYVDSTIAYQGYARGLDLATVRGICEAATAGRLPELTLLVDISLETSRARVAARNGAADRIDAQDLAFHRRVRDGYLDLARTQPRIVLLDGEAEPPRVLEAAMRAIARVAT
jgi:dTMP kinase